MCERDVERCPTLADMERASDGELSSPAERDAFHAHLRRCPACRDRMQACASLTRRVGHTLAADADRRAARARVTRTARATHFAEALHSRKQAQIHRRTSARFSRRWLSIAAVGPLLVLGILFSRTNTVVVHADELLTRAVTFERTRPVGSMQRVRIRLTPLYPAPGAGPRVSAARGRGPDAGAGGERYEPFLAVRELTNGVGADAWPSAVAARADAEVDRNAATGISANDDTAPLARLLARHRLDWRQPLSIAHVRAWRDGLRQKRDHVTPHGTGELLLRTTTMEGELREVQVTVRRETFHVTGQRLVFDGIGQIEIEEVAEWVRPQPRALVASAGVAAGVPAAVVMPDVDALQRAELDARLALRDAGADLGGGVRVSAGADVVRVDGRIGSVAVRRAVAARLSAMPLVRVTLVAGADGLPDPDAGAETSVTAPARPALGRWLDRTFGEEPSAAKATFVPRLERLLDTVTQRLAALDALAARYAGPEAARLSPAADAKLRRLLDLHYRALNADLLALDARVAVLFGSTPRAAAADAAPADWTRRVDTGRAHARTLDRLLETLLTREDLLADERQADGPRGITREFGALWEAVNGGAAPAPRPE